MPVKWEPNWPLPEECLADSEVKLQFSQQRDQIVHTLGNLTLITDSLNPSLSNGSWNKKRPELAKYSKLNLNRYFHPVQDGDDPLKEWGETAIRARGVVLFNAACTLWPY